MSNTKKYTDDFLSEEPLHTGFSAPKGYFDSVEDAFSTKLLEETLPKLEGFHVPEGYFNSLEDQLLLQVTLPKRGKVISLRKRLIRWIPATVAASIALLITLNSIFPKNDSVEPTSDDVAAWFEENLSAISNDDLALAFEDIDFDESSLLDNAIEGDDINKYLDENDTYILIEDSDIFINELN